VNAIVVTGAEPVHRGGRGDEEKRQAEHGPRDQARSKSERRRQWHTERSERFCRAKPIQRRQRRIVLHADSPCPTEFALRGMDEPVPYFADPDPNTPASV